MKSLIAIVIFGCFGLLAQLQVAPCPVYSLLMYWVFLGAYVLLFTILFFMRKYIRWPWIMGISSALALAFAGFNGGLLGGNLCLKDSNVSSPLARTHITNLEQLIQRYIVETQTLPMDLTSLSQRIQIDLLDPWGRPVRLLTEVKSQQPNCVQYTLESAGPDGAFENSDDVGQRFFCVRSGVCSSSCDKANLGK
jgi:hypothetical protein